MAWIRRSHRRGNGSDEPHRVNHRPGHSLDLEMIFQPLRKHVGILVREHVDRLVYSQIDQDSAVGLSAPDRGDDS